MFIDRVGVIISSGKGGDGAVSFRREKFVPLGGPDGGDGGRGGSVYFLVDNNADTLFKYKNRKVLKAKDGVAGGAHKKTGPGGEDLILKVPAGTIVIDAESEDILLDLSTVGEKVLFISGGKGGAGNFRYKSSTNQKPTYYKKGIRGVKKEVRLELKLIADVGFVGFPNVGKSTLISTITNSKAEVGNFSFTTITPNLGEVLVGSYDNFFVADIPGIIEGASNGKGLGIEFLKHIERTKVLLFMLDPSISEPLISQYKKLMIELKNYSTTLSSKRFAIVVTKLDIYVEDDLSTILDVLADNLSLSNSKDTNTLYLQKEDITGKHDYSKPYFIMGISSSTNINLEDLKIELHKLVNQK